MARLHGDGSLDSSFLPVSAVAQPALISSLAIQPDGAEYILGGNPTVPATSGRPTATASGGNMVFTFPRADTSETPDVTLTVETGTDLVTWPAIFTIDLNTTASSPGVTITENGAAPDTITVTIPQGTDTRKFARLKAMIAP